MDQKVSQVVTIIGEMIQSIALESGVGGREISAMNDLLNALNQKQCTSEEALERARAVFKWRKEEC